MNTISIILTKDGSVAKLKKDFVLYQDAYQNKVIDIYVPTDYFPPHLQDENGNVVYPIAVAVYIGSRQVTRAGQYVYSKKYNVPLETELVSEDNIVIKDFNVDGTTRYAKYSTTLPRDFTVYSGDSTLIVNVVTIDNTGENAVIKEIITSQEVTMQVNRSKAIEGEEVIDPTEFDKINGEINNLKSSKQDKVTEKIEGEENNQTVVTAINNNTRFRKDYQGRLPNVIDQINKNTEDINDLKDSSLSGRTYIGTLGEDPIISVLPEFPYTEEQIAIFNNFVQEKQGRSPQEGDYIELKVTTGDKFNLYIIAYKANSGWQAPDLQAPVDKAQNTRFGVLKGSTTLDGVNVDIVNGEIVGLDDVKLGKGLGEIVEGFEDGTLPVEKAKNAEKAKQDGQGNDIALTYAKADNVYTKIESDERFLPAGYVDIFYYSKNGLVSDISEVPKPSTQFEVNVPTGQIGNFLFFDVKGQLKGKYSFTKNTTDSSVLWLNSNDYGTFKLRLETSIIESNGVETLLAVEETGEIYLQGASEQVTIKTIYNEMPTSIYESKSNPQIRKKCYVISEGTFGGTLTLQCWNKYPSTFQLDAQGITYSINTVNHKKAIEIKKAQWFQLNGQWTVAVTRRQHGQPPSTEYGIELQRKVGANEVERILCTPKINANGNILITADEPIDCTMLIWSAFEKKVKETLQLENPTSIPAIDYDLYGGINIKQTVVGTPLFLLTPPDINGFYEIYVSNDLNSTQEITVDRTTIAVGKAVKFVYQGSWSAVTNNITTTGIYDDISDQSLNNTLMDYNNKLRVFDLGNRPLNTEFNIANAEELFEDYPLIVSVQVSNFVVTLHRSDMGLNGDRAYFSTTMVLNNKEFALTLVVTKATGKGILYQEEQPDNKTLNNDKQDKLSQVDLDNIASINQLATAVENNTNQINNHYQIIDLSNNMNFNFTYSGCGFLMINRGQIFINDIDINLPHNRVFPFIVRNRRLFLNNQQYGDGIKDVNLKTGADDPYGQLNYFGTALIGG